MLRYWVLYLFLYRCVLLHFATCILCTLLVFCCWVAVVCSLLLGPPSAAAFWSIVRLCRFVLFCVAPPHRISVLLVYVHSSCPTVTLCLFLCAFCSFVPQVSARFSRVCLGPAIAHGWRFSVPSVSILIFLGPSTAGLAVSGVPGLVILATGNMKCTGAPPRVLLFTPWTAIVGALPKKVKADDQSVPIAAMLT